MSTRKNTGRLPSEGLGTSPFGRGDPPGISVQLRRDQKPYYHFHSKSDRLALIAPDQPEDWPEGVVGYSMFMDRVVFRGLIGARWRRVMSSSGPKWQFIPKKRVIHILHHIDTVSRPDHR